MNQNLGSVWTLVQEILQMSNKEMNIMIGEY
jgi:hypothetical protein